MNCTEAREVLSDLIDVRAGEMPFAGDSRLAEQGMRAETEAHLASCHDCRGELAVLEAVGDMFADFSVGELPAQHFENYGTVVRARIARAAVMQMPVRSNRFSRWTKLASAAAAAACVAFAVTHFMPAKHAFNETAMAPSMAAKVAAAPRTWTPIPASNDATRFNVMSPAIDGMIQATVKPRDLVFNPTDSKPILDTLTKDERRFGYLVLREDPLPGTESLLGLALRTTRDEDRDLSNKDSLGLKIHEIEPNSVACEMGLRSNDLIVTINGLKINSGGVEDAVRFLAAVHHLGKGANVDIDFIRPDEHGLAFHVRKGVLGDPHATREAE